MSSINNKIKLISIEQPFLRVFAKYISQKFENDFPDLSNILLIFPSQRNKLYFRRYVLETSNNSGIIPPVMRTVDEFLEDIYEFLGGKRGMLLNRIERNFVLKQVIDSLKIELWQDLPFLKFISIGNRLLSFFDELSKERVTLVEIETEVLSGHYPEKYVRNELPIIKKIYSKYKKLLAEQSYQDEMHKYDKIYSQDSLELLKDYKYIGIAGLVATTTVENKIIKEILENLSAELIIHSSSKDIMKMTDTSAPFYLHNKLINAIGVKKINEIKTNNDLHTYYPVFHIKKTATESQQIFHLHSLLMKIKNRYEPHRIAVILTDESMVYSITETLKSGGFEYNVSVGFPFTQSILYSFLNQLKDVIENDFHYKEFFSFIKHPLFKNAIVDKKPLRPVIYRLLNYMSKVKLNYFDLTQEHDNSFTVLKKLVKDCTDTVNANIPLSEYISALIETLNKMLFYNQDFIKTDSADINEFFDRLHELTKLRVGEKFLESGIKILEFILRVLKDDTYNLQGDPMKGVQVIGFLEARNLDFDCIIMPSMNEGIFPKYSEKDLFINQPVRKKIGLPYDKERESLYYYYFTEMTRDKKEVFISYVEEEKRDIRSRFIDFLEEQGQFIDKSKIPLEAATVRVPKRNVKKNSSILNRLNKIVSGKGLSPTGLKDYKECPYRFYIKYLLNIQEPKEIVEEAGAREWGSIIHRALSRFYKYDFPDGFTEDEIKGAKVSLCGYIDVVLKDELAQKPRSVTFLDLEMYKKRLKRFLQHELERFSAGYTIDSTRLEKRLKYEILLDNQKVCLHGYADRVDIFDGGYYIIDYKSTIPPKKNYQIGENFVEFQLPLYALIISDEDFEKVSGMAYYGISTKIKITEIVERNNITQYLGEFKKRILLPIIKELLDPSEDFYQTDNKDYCTYCVYTDLCGVKNV